MSELQSITAGTIDINAGQLTQYASISLTTSNLNIRTDFNGSSNTGVFQAFNNPNDYNFTFSGNTNLSIYASTITVGSATTLGGQVALVANAGALNITGNVSTGSGGTITLQGSTMNFQGTLNTGNSVGTVNIKTACGNNGYGVNGTIGDASGSSSTWVLSQPQLQAISTGTLNIISGQLTVDALVNLTENANGPTHVNVSTNESTGGPGGTYQPYIDSNSYGWSLSGETSLSIAASSITTGSIGTGAAVGLYAVSGGLTVNGNIATTSGGSITLLGGTMGFTGTLNTGSSAGFVTLETNSNSIAGGIGGTSGNNTAPWAVTLAQLQDITTGTLNIYSGALTVYGNIDLSATNLTAWNINTSWNGSGLCCSGSKTYNGGTYSLNAGSGSLAITGYNVTTGSLTANSISVTSNGGQLYVPVDAVILAQAGNVTLLNTDTVYGSILLDTGSSISAFNGSFNGNVDIVVGASLPSNPAVGPSPTNTNLNPSNGGQIYFDTNGITGNVGGSGPDNTVNVNAAKVVFSTGTLSASAIIMNGSVTINEGSGPPPPPAVLLPSLDLTDPTIIHDIQEDLSNHSISGTLVLDGNGYATTGTNLYLSPVDFVVGSLSADNIPTGAIVNLENFTNTNTTPLVIALTNTSHTEQVVVSGTQDFLSTGPTASTIYLDVTTSSGLPTPVMTVGSLGTLSSDGNLYITVPSLSNSGTITATSGALSVSNTTGLRIAGTGTMTPAAVPFTLTPAADR